MKSKLLAITALCFGLVAPAPLAIAQTTGSTAQEGSGGNPVDRQGGSDASNYMTGPGVGLFYTDESMSELRSPEEIRVVYSGLSAEEQLMLRNSCASNEDTRFADLCAAIGTF